MFGIFMHGNSQTRIDFDMLPSSKLVISSHVILVLSRYHTFQLAKVQNKK